MTLDELLTKQRNQYLTTFQLGLAQNQTEKSATEIMLQVTADQNRHLPEVFQINRFDLVNITPEGRYNITEFNMDSDSLLNYDLHVFDINGMELEITPFAWNGCELTFDQKPGTVYESWIRKWIDINDNKSISTDSLQNVIHSVTYPQVDKNKWTTSIDFGSAPIEAFKELVMILSKQGISKVEVHSQSFRKS